MNDIPAERVELALSAIERLMKIHALDRAIYLTGAAAGMALLLYAVFLTIRGGNYDQDALGFFFGAGGVFATTGGLVVRILSKNFALIREILLAGVRSGSGGAP